MLQDFRVAFFLIIETLATTISSILFMYTIVHVLNSCTRDRRLKSEGRKLCDREIVNGNLQYIGVDLWLKYLATVLRSQA